MMKLVVKRAECTYKHRLVYLHSCDRFKVLCKLKVVFKMIHALMHQRRVGDGNRIQTPVFTQFHSFTVS